MATRGRTYTAIPSVPQGGLTPWQYSFLTAVKENVDLLTGSRGADNSRAVLTGQIRVDNAPNPTITSVTAVGAGVTLAGVAMPTLDDYTKLLSNVQQLINDVNVLRQTVNVLIQQLKG